MRAWIETLVWCAALVTALPLIGIGWEWWKQLQYGRAVDALLMALDRKAARDAREEEAA